ncbi:hypothetical protein C8R46DRAFT_1116051 [Mycena filopes]|nr:hypothetical protein C8R46DRAFT_1116051 [Mycena filopes]
MPCRMMLETTMTGSMRSSNRGFRPVRSSLNESSRVSGTLAAEPGKQVIGELSEGNDIEGSNQFVVHVDQLHSDTQADSFRGGADRLDNGDISASMLHGAPAAEPRVKSKGKFNKGKGKSLKGSNQTVRGANFQGRARQFTGHAQPHHDDSGAMIYGGAEQIYTPNTNAHASSSAISPATPTNALNADPAIAPLEAFLASINLTHHLRLFVAHRFTDIEVLRAVGKWWSDEVLRDFLRQALTGRREDLGGEAGLSVEEFGVVERAIRTLKHSEEAG